MNEKRHADPGSPPLPEAVQEIVRTIFVKLCRDELHVSEAFVNVARQVWEAAAQQERALRDALYELTAVGYLFFEEYNRDNVAITTWQRMGARLGLAHDLLHPPPTTGGAMSTEREPLPDYTIDEALQMAGGSDGVGPSSLRDLVAEFHERGAMYLREHAARLAAEARDAARERLVKLAQSEMRLLEDRLEASHPPPTPEDR